MNALRFIIKVSLLLVLVIMFNYHHGCKDPHEYEPNSDTLVPPPSAPQLVYPRNDTVLWYDQWHPYPNDIELGWSIVDDAEYYELDLSHDSTFIDLVGDYRVYTYHYTYAVSHNGVYYWRVRAYNENWTWYTDWSETWKFSAWYAP